MPETQVRISEIREDLNDFVRKQQEGRNPRRRIIVGKWAKSNKFSVALDYGAVQIPPRRTRAMSTILIAMVLH